MTGRRQNPIDLLVAWTALAVLGIGAIWDLSLSLFESVPTWCQFLRRWNTGSNDLLASMMFASIGYLFCRAKGDSRLLFVAWAFTGLFMHLFLLNLMHDVGIQSRR